MPESERLTFTHAEVVEALIRHSDIHDGLWALYVEFGLAAANINTGPDQFAPAAIVPVAKLGVQKVTKLDNLTVDAAKVNPKK